MKHHTWDWRLALGTVKTNPKWVWYPTSEKNYAVEPLYKIWLSKADLQNMGTKSLRDLDKILIVIDGTNISLNVFGAGGQCNLIPIPPVAVILESDFVYLP